MERATGAEVYGCGSTQSTDITLNIQTTTGGNFSVSLNGKNTVEHLKKLVSKKLKVSKDRICLLHRERQLREGTLEENGLLDGSRIILLPSVETGLLSQRPENSVMQALESLNDTQVNDFLSGKSPLNLTMRLGDHMMLIQLQLSTLNTSLSNSRSLRTPVLTKSSSSASKSSTSKHNGRDTPTPQSSPEKDTPVSNQDADDSTKLSEQQETYYMKKEDLETLCKDFYDSITEDKIDDNIPADARDEAMDTYNDTISDASSLIDDIKSLSNLVSSPLDSSRCNIKAKANAAKSSSNVDSENIDLLNQMDLLSSPEKNCDTAPFIINPESSSDDSDNFTDQSSFLAESTIDEYPMESLFNSAVDKGFFENQDDSMMDREISNLATTSLGTKEATTSGPLPSFQSINEPLKTKRFQYLLHKTSKFKHPIGQNKQKAFMQSVVNKHKKRMQSRQDNADSLPSTSRTEPFSPRKLLLQPSSSSNSSDDPQPSTSRQTVKSPDCLNTNLELDSPSTPVPDTRTLIEASKNLTQTLKKLSKEVFTNKIDLRNAEDTVRSKVGPGAVIESMKNHGKGVYSGTFSGTLNPALQDRFGRPKRDISTIIHILNDLLCATPPISIARKEEVCIVPHTCPAGAPAPSAAPAPCACPPAAPAPPAAAAPRSVPPRPPPCVTCADTRAQENSKTKGKLEHLRLVMQQKKQRREARRLNTLPYATPPKTLAPPEQTSQEEIETVA